MKVSIRSTVVPAVLSMALAGAVLTACAATSGSGAVHLPPPIPEGKGRLILQAGGIKQLNFYVLDAATGDEVYEDMPRVSSSSPSAYDTGAEANRLSVDLDAGTYTVVVNTDIDDDVVLDDVVVPMGQEVYKTVPVGRFQIQFLGGNRFSAQMPFLIWDYNMSTVLGRGMTTSEVRRFIVPEGRYKIRIENSPTGLDQIRDVEVSFGRITQVVISAETPQQPGPGQGDQTQ